MGYIKKSVLIVCETHFIKRRFRKEGTALLLDFFWISEVVRYLLVLTEQLRGRLPCCCTRTAEHNSSICSWLFWLKLRLPCLSSLSLPPLALTHLTRALTLTGAINASSKYSQPYKDLSKLRFTSKLWATSCILNRIQMKVFQSLYSIIIIKNISKSLKWVTAFPIPVLGSINNV